MMKIKFDKNQNVKQGRPTYLIVATSKAQILAKKLGGKVINRKICSEKKYFAQGSYYFEHWFRSLVYEGHCILWVKIKGDD